MRRSGTSLTAERGFSVVELMVAMTVSLILMAGVLQVFYSSKVTYLVNDQLSRLQENGRIAVEMIQRDIREAGYLGCAKEVPFTNTLALATPDDLLWNFAAPLHGYQATGPSSWLPAGLDTTVVVSPLDGSDVLAVRVPVRGRTPVPIIASMASSTDPLEITPGAPAPFSPGDVVMLADCNASAVFEVTASDPVAGTVSHDLGGLAPGNASNDIGYAFQADARLMAVETVIYYVRTGASGGPSLWRQAGGAPAEEIVEGVESLQIRYGIDANADRLVDSYATANAVGNWQNVLSVQVGLLVRSPDEATADVDTRTFTVLGQPIDPADDRRQRMIFTTTAALRNRAI